MPFISDRPGVTYAEVRAWIVWLKVFTISELADVMAVHYDVAAQFTHAAMWNRIIDDTGDRINGSDVGEEVIWQYVPLPPGPREHFTRTPPEQILGYTDIISPRGITQMLLSDRERRQSMSQPGVRLRIKNKERARRRQEQAILQRQEKDRQRQIKREKEGGKRFVRKAGKHKGERITEWEDD